MHNILTINQAISISKKLHEEKKKITLTGGCFDILHIGHFELLDHAKSVGDILMVLLESDEKIKKLKGLKRPFHTQQERAKMLTAIRFVDYIVLLPYFRENKEYDNLIEKISPNILAITENDPRKSDKERQARKIGALVKEVTPYVPKKSSSELLKMLFTEN